MWRRVKEFGPSEVFGLNYRNLTPFHEHFMDQAELAEQTYRQQEIRRNQNNAK